jgi:hypothetical protein
MTGTDWRSWVEDPRALVTGEDLHEELLKAKARAARRRR